MIEEINPDKSMESRMAKVADEALTQWRKQDMSDLEVIEFVMNESIKIGRFLEYKRLALLGLRIDKAKEGL